MTRNLFQITIKLCEIIFPNHKVAKFIKPYFKLFSRLIKYNGVKHTVKYLKELRLHCTKYICGQPLLENNSSIGIDSEGWPKRLSFLKPLANGSVSDKKLLLTLLLLPRTIKFTKDLKKKVLPDLSPIEKPYTGNYTIPGGFINKFVKHWNFSRELPKFDNRQIYLSNKGGPQGKASLSALQNMNNYSYNDLALLFKLTDQAGIDYISNQYKTFFEKSYLREKGKYFLGKISYVYDPELKVRVIAIVDYYRQLFFKPIHRDIFNMLKTIPMDRTFTQDPRHDWEDNNHSFWSLDLSSATDRFPVILQSRLLERIYNQEFANSWKLLLQKEFDADGSPIKYNCGQPMGSYSSWAAFTLSHHLVVQWCAHLNGFDLFSFNQYIILGDDIVIKNDNVAKTYISIIKRMGAELSINKTHVSKDTYEFAKRWFSKGSEITGFPLRGLVDNIHNPFIVGTIIYDFFKIKNNLYLPKGNLIYVISNLYKGLKLRTGKIKNGKTLYQFINFSKYSLRMEIFLTGLDRTFNYINNEKIRTIFNYYITNDLYQVPSDLTTTLSEYDRIVSDGIVGVTSNNIRSLGNFFEQSINYSKEKFKIETNEDFLNLPVVQGVINYLKDLKDRSSNVNFNEISLLEAIEYLSLIDIDKIFNKDRNKIQSLLTVGQSTIKGFDNLNKTDEIYYGSASTESTYTSSDILSKQIGNLVDPILQQFDNPKITQVEEEKPLTYEEQYLKAFGML